MAASVYSRTFQKAAELAGGRAKLCRALRVPSAELERWIADRAVPPIGVFLRAVDLIIVETPAAGGDSSSDPGDAPAPQECAGPSDAATGYC